MECLDTIRVCNLMLCLLCLQNSDSEELSLVRQERDELQRLLDKFERHMAEVRDQQKRTKTKGVCVWHMYFVSLCP
jgi:hypothetical protein